MRCLVIVVCACCIAILYVIVRIETLRRAKLQCDYEKQIAQLRMLLEQSQSHSQTKELLIRRDTLRHEWHNAKVQIYSETSNWSEREKRCKDVYDTLIHYRSWNQFQTFVDQQFNCFLSRLSDRYSELSEQQQLLAFLYILNVDNEDIALVMNFQLSSLPNTKLRLAKKMNLSGGALLQPTLEGLLCTSFPLSLSENYRTINGRLTND
ncbi:MAG: hypothetical protein MJZ65_04740 [Paludibacteraceae bacterium]|nr:hypothetical protein [Paludibacteraceae bacterium]